MGPSGVGKTTLLKKILETPLPLKELITYTTRKMREGEENGRDYFFVSREEFEEKIKEGFFVEWVESHGKRYGTPKDQITNSWNQGLSLIFDVDYRGALCLMEKYPENTHMIFLGVPSIDALRLRIKDRGSMDEKELESRMKVAQKEMEISKKFHTQLINEDLKECFEEIQKVIEKLLFDV